MKRLRWTTPAEEDLAAIDANWCGHAIERADEVLAMIEAAGDFLAALPKAGPATEMEDFRKWPVGGTAYVLLYRIRDDAIEILRVHHGSENWRSAP